MNKENLQTTSVDKKYKKDIKYKENVQRGRLCNISDVKNIVVLICIIIRTKVLIHLSTFFRRKKKGTFDTASKISEPRLGEQYRVIADYTKEDKWDLNLKAGTEVEVIEKTESGRYTYPAGSLMEK